ncbi:hypothetical protein TL16_g13023 [Triparma laevis f. inornata]|uniref:polynucleotide adenylyltransferase n=1 Tax=Triparma laevis f. inornata TaxID=1714386 RepID=A0A9W7BW80_9STRA|nr:hypothetical protein TL16_g13023 [Triparma laevis f. inornata]
MPNDHSSSPVLPTSSSSSSSLSPPEVQLTSSGSSSSPTKSTGGESGNTGDDLKVYLPKPIDDKHDEEWEVKRGTELDDFLGNGVEGDDGVEASSASRENLGLNNLHNNLHLRPPPPPPPPPPPSKSLHPTIIPFGSYALKVHSPSSDIDVLCLASPPPLTPVMSRSQFFSRLKQYFETRMNDDFIISDVTVLINAFTPVMKFKINCIDIDLVYAQIKEENLEEYKNEYLGKETLRGLDAESLRSVNGVLVTNEILSIVGKERGEVFRLALRGIKRWAKGVGIYGNGMGFLGGVNFAIMVAWVCGRFPNAGPARLFQKFFQIYSTWSFPSPILLSPLLLSPPPGWTPQQIWNPTLNPRDAYHLLPIITPCYPSMNSSYNVGKGQLRRIMMEVERGREVVDGVMKGRGGWEEVFRESTFFNRFTNYLEVRCVALTPSDFRRWQRWVESKIRILIAGLEMAAEQGVEVHPFAKFFDVVGKEMEVCGTSFFIGLRSLRTNGDIVDLSFCTNEFLYAVSNWEGRVQGMEIFVQGVSGGMGGSGGGAVGQQKVKGGGGKGKGRARNSRKRNGTRRGNGGGGGGGGNSDENKGNSTTTTTTKGKATTDGFSEAIGSPTKKTRMR